LPVKVWLYGGSNEGGSVSDPLYDGCNSAADSIVVSVNFRLGPLGFLAYPDAGITGNYGIQDQLLALRWVQDEISSFGGDPDKVLLFGQSAGAMDSYLLSSLPQAPSLFRAVALESGGGRDSPSVADTKAVYGEYIRSLDCDLDDALACLRDASLTALNKTTISLDTSSGNILGAETFLEGNGSGNAWLAVVDGDIVPKNPASVGIRVPAIIGSNSNDGSLDVLSQYTTNALNITQADYYEFLENSFGPLAATVNETYSWSAFVAASPVPGFTAMTTVITDYAYKCPAYRALRKAAANGVDAWAYNFNHTPSCAWYSGIPNSPVVLKLLGATHTSEIPFVFGWTSGLARPDGSCNFTATEVAISDFMLEAWTSMAASGRPANSSVWPAWTANGSKGITVSESVTAGSLDYSECEFWDKIQAGVLEVDASMVANATNSSSSSVATSKPAPISGSDGIRVPSGIVFGLTLLLAICMM
jgi:carboxylesterase type B